MLNLKRDSLEFATPSELARWFTEDELLDAREYAKEAYNMWGVKWYFARITKIRKAIDIKRRANLNVTR